MKKTRMKALLLGCICAVTTALSAVPASAATVVAGGSSATNDPALTAAPGTYTEQQSGGTSVDKPAAPPTVWVVGDSTAAAFSDTTYYSPRYGWGTQLGLYLQGVNIRNLAISGTSSKSYSDTDQYQTLLQSVQAGDYVLIGFGHNDERTELGRYSNPTGSVSSSGSFQYNLYEKYIKPVKNKQANPILAASNYTGEDGHITTSKKNEEGTFQGGDYAKAIRQLGVGKSVPVLDLTARTKDVYERLGADGVKNRHAQTSDRDVSIDNTHTNLYGAQCNAWFIADELLKSNSGLKNYVIPNPQVPQYDSSSLNAGYHAQSFTAPAGVSSIFSTAGDWKPTVFGNIDGYEYLNNMYFCLQGGNDNSFHLAVGTGSGATRAQQVGGIEQGSDGLAMFYREVPASANFTLSADITINAYNASVLNSFGLMVRDDIYLDTVINDTLGDYVAAGELQLSSASPWNCFARKNGQLISGGTASRVYKAGETVHVEIRKGPDGYTCVFGDNAPVSAGFDFPLTAVDSDHVYVGLFVARSADVTFRNVNLIYQ